MLAHARRVLAEVDDLVHEARGGHARLRLGHAWAAMGAHRRVPAPLGRAPPRRRPAVGARINTPTSGLAEGACDAAIVRAPTDTGRVVDGRIDGVVVGLESRYCRAGADDPLARRRHAWPTSPTASWPSIPAGTTTPDLWPRRPPRFEEIHDVDDWLAVIATGRCVGVTAESTTSQYGRRGIVFRRLRDAPPVPARLIWWRDSSHPATRDVVGLLAELYRRGAHSRAAGTSR